MINRVKLILGSRRGMDPLDSYFFNVQKCTGCPVPTFDEARKDFKEMVRSRSTNYN